jgi:hypothetical protein
MKRFIAIALALMVAGLVVTAPALAKSDPTDRCVSQKLNAAAIYAKKVFYCAAQTAMNTPATTPDEFLDALSPVWDCLDAGWTEFQPKWDDGTVCPTTGDAAAVRSAIESALYDNSVPPPSGILPAILYGGDGVSGGTDDLDLSVKEARKLVADILKGGGQKIFSLLKAESKDAVHPNATKHGKAVDKAMAKFEKKWAQAAKKAKDVGKGYDGDDVNDVDVLEVEGYIDDLLDAIMIEATPL